MPLYAHPEAHWPDYPPTGQTGLVASPIGRECRQAKTAAGRSERTGSRAARPDTQPVEVSWEVILTFIALFLCRSPVAAEVTRLKFPWKGTLSWSLLTSFRTKCYNPAGVG